MTAGDRFERERSRREDWRWGAKRCLERPARSGSCILRECARKRRPPPVTIFTTEKSAAEDAPFGCACEPQQRDI